MGEEAQAAQAAPEAKPEVINPQTAPKGSEGSEHVEQNPGKERWSGPALFEDEAVSEAQLRGLPEPEQKPAGEEGKPPDAGAKAGEKEPEKPEAKKEAQPAKKEEPAKPEAGKPEEGKPPAGFVPLPALHEERGKRQKLQEENAFLFNQNSELQAQLQRLNGTLEAMQGEGKKLPDNYGEFKVLSPKEFEALKEDDPTDAMTYLHKLQSYNERKKVEDDQKARLSAVVSSAYQTIGDEAPEIFAEDGEYSGKLIAFAEEHGIPRNLMPVLTNPNTQVMAPGSTAPVLLGHGAAFLVRFINNMYKDKGQKPDMDALRDQMRQELEPEVTAKIMEKLKKSGGAEFRDLDVPTEGAAAGKDTMQPFSEDSYSRMSEADKRRYLGG